MRSVTRDERLCVFQGSDHGYRDDCLFCFLGYWRWRSAELPLIPLTVLAWLVVGIVLASVGGTMPLHHPFEQGMLGGLGAALILGGIALLPPLSLRKRGIAVVAMWLFVGLNVALVYMPSMLAALLSIGVGGIVTLGMPFLVWRRVVPRLRAEDREERIAALEGELADLIGNQRKVTP